MGEPHVVIVGGGFGGLYAAKAFRGKPVRVTLVDRKNHHVFQPLLYQVASAALSPADIASPIRTSLRSCRNVTVLLAEATGVDCDKRELVLTDGRLGYDHLIVAAGARHSYFGKDEWEAAAPGLKTLEDALEIRRRLLLAYEKAERESDPQVRAGLLTFVVVGGGPTGVELAGALGEIARWALADDFRNINPADAKVILVEAGPRILASFPEHLSVKAERFLAKRGVQVRTKTAVTAIEPGTVTLAGERTPASTVLWAAGVKASPLAASFGLPLDRAGRVSIKADLTIEGRSEISVIGDMSVCLDPDTGKPLPGVAPVAMQQGTHAAQNVLRAIAGQERQPFRYKNRGSMAVVGRGSAVADLGTITFAGRFAWMIWAVVHIFFLVGFRNRFLVMLQWMWQYATFRSGARLITGEGDLRGPAFQAAGNGRKRLGLVEL